MKTCVILPAFNEAGSIAEVIRSVKRQNIDLLVVNDGSSDETSSIARREGAYLIEHDKRRGKGASLKDGFDYAGREGYDIIITMDADGQHAPSDIPKFIDTVKRRGVSVVIGNRMANPTDMPRIRIITNWIMSAIISAICRQRIPDTQCGYRLFTRGAIDSIEIKARKFEIDSEMLVKLAGKGYRIESIAVRSIYAGETSQIRPMRDAFRFVRFLIKMALERD